MTTSSPLGGGSHEPDPSHAQQHPQPYGTTTTNGGAPGPGPGAPKGLAIAALVAGIVAFLTGLLPVVGLLVGVAAVVLGVLALRRRQPKALAVTGLALGAVGLVVSLLVTIGLGAVIRGASEEPVAAPTSTADQEAAVPSPTPAETRTPTPTPTVDPDVPADYAAALKDAEPRALSLNSSRAVTYDSLISGGASPEAATYAVDNIGVDWKENAVKKAKAYVDGGLPVDTLHDQLTSEFGEAFTVEEADYAMEHLDD